MILKRYALIDKHIYILALMKFVNSLCNFVIPFLSLYCTSTLGLSIWDTGIIVSISNVFSIVAILIGGRLSKKVSNKKIFVVYMYLLSAVCYILVVIIESVVFKILLIIIGFTLSSIAIPMIDYFVGHFSREEDNKVAFSLIYLSHNIAIGIGAMFSGILFSINSNLIFIFDALTIIFSTLIIIIFFDFKGDTYNTKRHFEDIQRLQKNKMKVPKYKKIFLIVMVIYAISYAQVNFLLPIFLNKYSTVAGSQIYGVLMSINAITVIIFTPIVTSISNKICTTIALIIAGGLFMAGYMGYNINLSIIILGTTTLIWSLGEIFCSINHMPLLIENENKSEIGVYSSYANTANRLGTVVSSLIGAGLVNLCGYRYIWIIVGFVVMAGIVLMCISHKLYLLKK